MKAEGSWERLHPPKEVLRTRKPLRFEAPEDGEFLLPATQLPLEDNEVLETNQHRIAMNALIRAIKHHWAGRTDFIVGGNMFVYFSPTQARTHDYRGPDFFVALDVNGSYSRQAWIAWEENGKLPDVIIELLSDSTKAVDLGIKKTLYEQTFKTTDYFVFDPFDAQSLRGWHLSATGRYEELEPNPQGRLWSAKLGLWVGVWEGLIEDEFRFWLRFYDAHGQLVPLIEEAAVQKVEVAVQEKEAAVQKAEVAEQKAEVAKQEREAAVQKAEVAEQQAEAAEQKAKEASQRAERLAEQLRRLGLDPDRLT
jgi:Uma2 family endonuclease